MKMVIKTVPLLDKLDRAERIVSSLSSSERKVVLHVGKSGAWLSCYADSVFAQLSLAKDVKVEGTGAVCIDTNIFIPLLKKRAEITMTVGKDGRIQFKASDKGSAYGGEVAALPVTPQVLDTITGRKEEVIKELKKGGMTLSSRCFDVLAEGIRATVITPTHKASDTVTHLRCKAGKVSIGTTDRFHAALYRSAGKVDAPDFELAVLPAYFEHFDKVQGIYSPTATPLVDNPKKGKKGAKPGKIIKAPTYDMSLTMVEGKRVTLSSADFIISLPAVQADPKLFDSMIAFEAACEKECVADMELSHETLAATMDNLRAIKEPGMVILCKSLEVSGKQALLKLSSASGYGKLADTVKVKPLNGNGKGVTLDAHLDPDTFEDSLARMSGSDDLQFRICEKPKAYRLRRALKMGSLTHTGMLLNPRA